MYAYEHSDIVAICANIEAVPQGVTPIEVDTLPEGYREAWDILEGKLVINPDKKKLFLSKEAKATRDAALVADIEFDGVMFQYNSGLLETVNEAAILGMGDDTAKKWRLADNSFRVTTLAELKGIVGFAALRKADIWDQFEQWHEGDKLEPFTVT